VTVLKDRVPIPLNDKISITPISVPHREEFSETVGFRIDGPEKSLLYIPDTDTWDGFKENSTLIDLISRLDYAFIDGTFFSSDELEGIRDFTQVPHPLVNYTMNLLSGIPVEDKNKVHFIHLNHTNPLIMDSPLQILTSNQAKNVVQDNGFKIAHQGQRIYI